jgi:Holliday junction resolvase RusA-like endonuclease
VTVFLTCVPPKTNHHAKKIVRIGKFSRMADNASLVAAKATLDELLLPHQPTVPVPGPVVLTVTFTWPWLTSHTKRFRALGRQPHTSKPDCSNVVKTLEDRLVQLRFIDDDRAVVELHVRKFWGDRPGITIELATLETP